MIKLQELALDRYLRDQAFRLNDQFIDEEIPYAQNEDHLKYLVIKAWKEYLQTN